MTARVVDGRKIAAKIRSNVAEQVKKYNVKYSKTPCVTTVKVGDDASSAMYLRLRDNACKEAGIRSTHLELPNNSSEKKIIDEIKKLNKNPKIHGILVQFPMPKNVSSEKIMNAITPLKDVEGFNPINMGKTLIGEEYLVPCTPLSVLTILEHEKIKIKAKNIVIINHSTVVGKPLTALFLNRDATVSICHVYTENIKEYTSKADILVTATGIPKLIKNDHIKKDAVVIDVGIVATKQGVCGDVDFEEVKQKASTITPVPGGVGPVTIACCLQNMIKTYKNCIEQ